MPKLLRAGLILALALVLSGCVGSKTPPASATATDAPLPITTSSSTHSVTQTSSVQASALGIPSEIAWNKCQGLESTIFFYNNVVNLDNGETPPGWEATPTQDDRYFFQLNHCERVSVGSFERGPANFLIETHTGVNPPESCSEFNDGSDDLSILLGMWVDDQELATFLAATYHLPIQFGTFSLTVNPTADGQTQQWTWKGDGEESSLTAFRPGGDEGISPYLDRLVWHNQTGVSFLDMHNDFIVPYNYSPPGFGLLAPPMKYSQGTTRPYSSIVTLWNQGDFYGPIYRFGDMECKNLLA